MSVFCTQFYINVSSGLEYKFRTVVVYPLRSCILREGSPTVVLDPMPGLDLTKQPPLL